MLLAMIVLPITSVSAHEVASTETTGTLDSHTPLDVPDVDSSSRSAESSNLAAPAVIGEVLQYALSHDGKPYRRGGSNPESGFDCSGFVRHVFEHVGGIELPHSANAISKIGRLVTKAELLPGDLVFFRRMKKHIGHVGIYLGEDKFIHASSRRTGRVMVSSLTDRYWAKRFVLARHLEPLE
jgi:cell wall-associated NlpC family hydrolase